MALTIASVPVLTGEVAEKFEAEAQKNYEKFINRNEEERVKVAENYKKGMDIVKRVLAKSQIGKR